MLGPVFISYHGNQAYCQCDNGKAQYIDHVKKNSKIRFSSVTAHLPGKTVRKENFFNGNVMKQTVVKFFLVKL